METGTPLWWQGAGVVASTLRRGVTADVCVVGLGASGLAAVRALVDRGVDVVGVDAGPIGGGASGRNGGFLLAGAPAFHHRAVARHGRRRASAIYRLTLEELDAMAADTPEAVRRVGSLRIAVSSEEEADCRSQLAAMRRDGLPVQSYEGPEGSGLYFPADASLQPWTRCQVLAQRLQDLGVRLFTSSPVTRLEQGRVITVDGSVACRHVVVTVDGGIELLLPELAASGVRTARAQMLATAPTTEATLDRPVYARWGLDYWQQSDEGAVVLGGCRDVGGEAEWTTSPDISSPVQAGIERLLRERLGVRAAITHRWAGSIAFTPDLLPVIATVRPGVVAAGAYSGTGNVLGALCARAAVELALDGRSDLADIIRS